MYVSTCMYVCVRVFFVVLLFVSFVCAGRRAGRGARVDGLSVLTFAILLVFVRCLCMCLCVFVLAWVCF